MANDYYEVITDLDAYTRARSGVVDAEFAGVEAGFELLPSLAKTRSANPSFVAAGGTANAITVAHPIVTWASYTGKDGHKINIQITTTNTDAVTLAVDGLATKACKRNDGTALQAGDLVAAGFYDFIYDETAGYFVCPEAINGVLTDATAQAVAAAASASSASTSASTATTQASNASTSAIAASTSASTASTSATTSINYATKVDGYASGADNSAKSWAIGGTGNGQPAAGDAKSWATTAEDVVVAGGLYSSKHYSIKAAASAATAGANLAGQINGATAKTPLVDNDEFGIADSAASYALKKTLWSTIKSTLWTALGALISGGTGKTTPVSGDIFAISDSAASNATKKLTLANLSTYLGSLSQTLTNKTIAIGSNTITGTLPVANGGTGATTLTGILKGNGTGAFSAVTAPTGTIVGTSDTQTLTNKTLTTPAITDPVITGTIGEDVYTITDAAGFEINPRNGSIQLITLGANRTPVATTFNAGDCVTLGIDDGSAYAITWTTVGVTWVGGVAPPLETSGYTWVVLWKVGSTIYGRY